MRARSIGTIISLGVAVGCIAGIIVAVKEIAANRYLSYAMHTLCADVLQKSLNRWTGIGIAASGVMIVLCLLYRACSSALQKERPRGSESTKTVNARLSLRYAAVLASPFVMVLVATNLLPALLDPGGYRPPVILISIDDLRADHVGCYGYERNTTPHLDAFAREGIIFQNCYVPEPWTLTSHMSMLTSLYPLTHGVTMANALPPAIVTLAEVLSNKGYFTMGFVSGGPWTSDYYGFRQGFKEYRAAEPDDGAAYQNSLVEKLLEQQRGESLFIFIHYFDVHSDNSMLPYDSPPPYDNLFSNWYSGAFKGGERGVVASKYLGYLNREQIRLGDDDRNYIISLYDNGIAYMDKCIGDLFAILRNRGLFDDALIIVTADHGEEFQEHGFLSHGSNPYYYEESVRVPLIMKLPKGRFTDVQRGWTVEGLVESIDIMPTILDFLAIEGPRMEGASLSGAMRGSGKGKAHVFGLGSGGRLFVRSQQWKLLNDQGLSEGRFKLFDLYDDPGEKLNRSGEGLVIEGELKKVLQERIALSQQLRKELTSRTVDVPEKTISLTDEEKEKLRALGYLQ